MLTLYFTNTNTLRDADMARALDTFPIDMRNKIVAYQAVQEQKLRVCGKLLLGKLLSGLGAFSLQDIQYNNWGRPFVSGHIDFNLSHSGDIAICAATNKGKVGVDIEHVKQADITLFKGYFTSNEWRIIETSEYKLWGFYKMWARKEALMKAVGKGVFMQPGDVDVAFDEVHCENRMYYVKDIFVLPGYAAAIACDAPIGQMDMKELAASHF
jgi:4'-phosphopantetheinyl transferase